MEILETWNMINPNHTAHTFGLDECHTLIVVLFLEVLLEALNHLVRPSEQKVFWPTQMLETC